MYSKARSTGEAFDVEEERGQFNLLCNLGLGYTHNMKASRNKQTVQRYMDVYAKLDHAEILACLTDDVEWLIPGVFQRNGKAAFDKEIENDAFTGRPDIRVTRMTEQDDVVVAEGNVRCARKDGGMLNMDFCDVFEMRDGKIRRLISYLMEIKQPAGQGAT
jgi:ketosteroid isomerase-like protein